MVRDAGCKLLELIIMSQSIGIQDCFGLIHEFMPITVGFVEFLPIPLVPRGTAGESNSLRVEFATSQF